MAGPALVKTDTNKSTDEDYESDDSDIERITTRLVDPGEDVESLDDLEERGKVVLEYGPSRSRRSGAVFLAETGEEGPLAGVYLCDGDQSNGEELSSFLSLSTGQEISPLTTQYLHSMISLPYKEGVTFEPLLKEIFASNVFLKFLYFVTEKSEELPWYVKQFARKLDYSDQSEKSNVFYIDSKDILPTVHIAPASIKEEAVLEDMVLRALPEYPVKISKILRGFVQTSHEPLVILGAYQEPQGVVIVNPNVDVEKLNQSYQLSAFNHLIAPQRTERKSSQCPVSQIKVNCFQLQSYFMERPGSPVQVLSLLFQKFPDRDYCLVLLPRLLPVSLTIADLFLRVSPRPEVSPSQELYLCHKMSLMAGLKVDWVRSSHISGVNCLVSQEKCKAVILRDVQHSLQTDGSDAKTIVVTCHDQVIGVAVFRTEYDTHHLRTHYDADLGDAPVRLHHLVLAPVFQRFARYILCQILRVSGQTALVYPVFRSSCRSREKERYSPITVLDELLLARPRHRLLPFPLPLQPAFSMFFINQTDALQPLTVHHEKIVIVGSSPLALATAEMFASKRLDSFPNLFLVTEDNLETDFSPNVVNLAPPAWGQMEMGRRSRLSLQSVVNVIVGRISHIDRTHQRIVVDGGSAFSYDKIILCVEKSSYSLNNSFVTRKGINRMSNFFTLETLSAGKRCLDYFQTSVDNMTKDGYIIIIGHNLHAIATINSLIELGAPARCFLLVRTEDEGPDGGLGLGGDETFQAKIFSQLKLLGVRVKTYNLIDFKKAAKKNLIETVIFSKNDDLVEASCLMLVNCNSPCVGQHLLDVVTEADLVVLEEAVVVNSRQETNDPNILSSGSGTRLDRISGLRGRTRRNPQEEGMFLARMLFNQLVSTTTALAEDDSSCRSVKFPSHVELQLPGGLCYLSLTNHGDVLSSEKCLRSSSEAGEVALYINHEDKITGLEALYHGYLPTENLARINNLHVSTLPGLKQADDIIQFLQQPKFSPVFHEGFQELRERIRKSILSRADSGSLVGEIVLNPERSEEERLERLRHTWREKKFDEEIKNNLKIFMEKYQAELPRSNVS